VKARLVKNNRGDDRVVIEFETDKERELFDNVDCLEALVTSCTDETLVFMSFVIVYDEPDDDSVLDGGV
jgi:hypothetical protein